MTSNVEDVPTTAKEALDGEPALPTLPNIGNPVFSCVAKIVVEDENNYTANFVQQHPLYRTSANAYGGLPPTAESCPSTFHAKSQRFSQHLGVCGMYRNNSLNTAITRSRVHDEPKM